METLLNKGIKEIITEYPEIENILNDYDIGCGPCSVGTCLLKDIVSIHNLAEDQERHLMARIANATGSESDSDCLPAQKQSESPPKEFKYSPPIQKLVDEHVLIKRLIALTPMIADQLDVTDPDNRQIVIDGVDMIRSYADRFHHAKEEEILFTYFDENTDILKGMMADHMRGRSHVKEILEALEKEDGARVSENLMAYRELLTEHIRKEDEILYPWMDKNLSTTQIGELYSKFQDADRETGISPKKYESFVLRLEEKFINKKEDKRADENVHTVDLRQLPPPERQKLIFKTWNAIKTGETMQIINDHDPKPLRYLFAAEYEGMFEWVYRQEGPMDWVVNIKRI